jgi:hypothetical protein
VQRRAGLLLIIATLLLVPIRVGADNVTPKNKGLFITPLRTYLDVRPGNIQNNTFTVANITEQPITVDLSVQQFSVADYSYDYRFSQVHEDWVKMAKTQLSLQPNKSESLTYTVAAPTDASPGGHYFTLFATAKFPGNPNKVQAATVLYVTVAGDLHRTSVINKESIPWISFDNDIDFSMDIKNTGNTHFFTYSSGRMQGLSAKSHQPEVTNLLLPGTSRVIGSTIPAPLLPGVYKAVYGYKTDDNQAVWHSIYIIYLPPWSLLVPLGIIWLLFAIRRYRAAHQA